MRSNAELLCLTAGLALAGLVVASIGLAQEARHRDIYISDSQRERTPAITAFPKYPYVARRDRMEGETTVCFTVNSKGQVIRPSIRSSSHRIFEKPAMWAIRASTFEPLKAGEIKSPLKVCRIYRFKLDAISASNETT